MEYNTTREKLRMPEYGRGVQQMVEHLFTIENKEKRLEQANIIIDLMATLNPHLKSVEDYKHKLWDHLHLIGNFELDIDGPYPKPEREKVFAKPEPLPYPQSSIKYRHFGKNLVALMDKALSEEDPQRKQGYTQIIGYYMKLAYTNWHREPVHDDMIRNELDEMTNGALQYEQGGYKVYFDTRQQYQGNAKPSGVRGYKQGGNRNFKQNGYNKNRKFNKNKSK